MYLYSSLSDKLQVFELPLCGLPYKFVLITTVKLTYRAILTLIKFNFTLLEDHIIILLL